MKNKKTRHRVADSWVAKVGAHLGMNGGKHLAIMERLAAHYGEKWLVDKLHGDELIRRYLDEHFPTWNPPQQLPKKDRWAQEQKAKRKAQKQRKKRIYAPTPHPSSDEFLASYEWRKLRMEVLKERGPTCECCGTNAQRDRVRMNVDHIKPRRYFPALALDKSNLQVLCEPCNHGKGNWDQTDWREPEPSVMPMWHDPMRPRLVKKGTA